MQYEFKALPWAWLRPRYAFTRAQFARDPERAYGWLDERVPILPIKIVTGPYATTASTTMNTIR